MRKLIYLLIIVGAAYYFYTNSDSLRQQLRPLEDEAFNRTPQEWRGWIFSTTVPEEYQGRYISDLKANADWARQQNYPTKLKNLLVSLAGKTSMEILPDKVLTEYNRQVDTSPVELVKRNENSIELEYYSDIKKSKVVSLVERDDEGIWVHHDYIKAGYKERYRKIKPQAK